MGPEDDVQNQVRHAYIFLPCIRKIGGKTGKTSFDHYHGWFDPSKQQILKCADVCNTKSHSLHKNVSTSHIIDIILD